MIRIQRIISSLERIPPTEGAGFPLNSLTSLTV